MKTDNIIHDTSLQQFKLPVGDNQIAKIDYKKKDGKFYLVHSEVPYALRGQGIGQQLVKKTYDFIQANGWEAVPICSYVKTVAARMV